MSNFLIFKAAFNNSATPAIGTYTAEGATAQFYKNTSISPDYYLYNTVLYSAVQWFVPTKETTDFEFVADILTRRWDNRVTYFIIADSTGTTRLRMWSQYDNWFFESSDSTTTTGSPEFIGNISPKTSGGFNVFHQFRVRVRKLTESSSSVEVYVDGTLKLTATAGAALVTCAKIGFVGGVNSFGPGTGAGIKNAYVYDLSGGDVVDRGVLSGAFTRFISWMKSKFALKSDIPTVNDATLTIQRNGTNVQTFTANQSTNATANITVPTAVSELTNDSGYLTSSSNLDASKLTSGTVDIERLPQGALERLVKVANEAARYALTTADVQLGDTVQQLDTGIMYAVTDTDHLDSAAGYTEYTAGTAASVPWSGVTSKPTFAAVATSGAYSDLTGTPTIPTVNDATLTIQQNGTTVNTFTANSSSDKTVNISVPTKTSDLNNDSGFITGVTWNDVSNKPSFATVATSGSYNDLSNKPTIPKVNNGTLTIQKNGTTVDTFTANSSTDKTVNISVPTNTSELTNGAGYITADYAVPRSGGAVMTGDFFGRDVSNSDLTISGGASRDNGSRISLNGINKSNNYAGAVTIATKPTNASNPTKYMELFPGGTWTWNGTAVQITSDQRLKQQIAEIDDKLLDAWEDVELAQFKYNDAVDQKGKDKARLHTGYVVQQIDKACKSHNVDISAYGLYCHEEYPQETEEVEVEQADGTKTKERKVIREASEHYSLRYTEVYAVECMYLRRCIARLTARIEELEKEQEAGK